uniref:Carbohydrate sulfotransferase n=1 Tax=Labrus bergylta TaxID=56723 RepID=A0A3Q3F4Q5_9LABR|nr:carbohydrate sulfotransferase 8-like [Labrus bergylta]
MRSPNFFLWFLFLLGVGCLPLLLHLEYLNNTFRQLRTVPTDSTPDSAARSPQTQTQTQTPTDDAALETEEGGELVTEQEDEADDPTASHISSLIASLMTSNTTPLVTERLKNTSAGNSTPTGWEEGLQQLVLKQELRHQVLANICSKYQLGSWDQVVSKTHMSMIHVEDQSRLLYCEVPKVGCSNWKRVLMVLAGRATSVLNIPHVTAHFKNKLRKLEEYGPKGINQRLNTYTKVLFVRDPFERLVSAYRDKFENKNDYYHSLFGRPIISRYRANPSQEALRTGDGVTFREFVHYLLDPQRPVGNDIHWAKMSTLCPPCVIQYDFIGKFENMNSEANFLLRSIGAPQNLSYPDYKDRNPEDERTHSSIMKKYFSQLNATERQGVYDFYRIDYEMFDFPKPLQDLH